MCLNHKYSTNNYLTDVYITYFPQTLLPRGEKTNPLREKHAKVNSVISEEAKKLERVQVMYYLKKKKLSIEMF